MLDRFYPVVSSSEWIYRLLPMGVKLVQLRVKNSSLASILDEIKKSKQLCERFSAQLVVNDYWKEAIETGCDFIHLGQGDLDTADTPAIRKAGLRLGISTHDEVELERALILKPHYIALGPIYPTILKSMPFAPQGLSRITQWKSRIKEIPLVAIGGLRLDRLKGVLEAGADSLAVATDITLNENPEEKTRQWIEATR
jgi:thiamine-phosphate pyrophosphorylase